MHTFYELAGTVDVIIHSGAERALFEDYEQLAAPNVHATKEIIKLAAPLRVPVHFLSSGAVTALESKVAQLPNESPLTYQRPPPDESNGYVASK
jgi:hybrid polyketide synthase / nonribosomal peptide synthetase ACE1